MTTYKLFKIHKGKLYPLYVESGREMPIGTWLEAHVGELADETHVKAKIGKLSLRPGFHSALIPYTNWIGKRMPDGSLVQRSDTVWCECEVKGSEQTVTSRRGLRTLPDGYYKFKTNPKQKDPWVISRVLFIKRILSDDEVDNICKANGLTAQVRESREEAA